MPFINTVHLVGLTYCHTWIHSGYCRQPAIRWWIGINKNGNDYFPKGTVYVAGFCEKHACTPISREWDWKEVPEDEVAVFLTMEE